MFRPKAAISRLSQLQFCSKSVIYICLYWIWTYIDTEQNFNCDNLTMAAVVIYFANKYHHLAYSYSCVF